MSAFQLFPQKKKKKKDVIFFFFYSLAISYLFTMLCLSC